jgi:hypothetical protein
MLISLVEFRHILRYKCYRQLLQTCIFDELLWQFLKRHLVKLLTISLNLCVIDKLHSVVLSCVSLWINQLFIVCIKHFQLLETLWTYTDHYYRARHFWKLNNKIFRLLNIFTFSVSNYEQDVPFCLILIALTMLLELLKNWAKFSWSIQNNFRKLLSVTLQNSLNSIYLWAIIISV